MSLPPYQPFSDEEEDRRRKAEIEDMMRWQRESYFRAEPVQQEYRDLVTRLSDNEGNGVVTDFRRVGPFDLAPERFQESRRASPESDGSRDDVAESDTPSLLPAAQVGDTENRAEVAKPASLIVPSERSEIPVRWDRINRLEEEQFAQRVQKTNNPITKLGEWLMDYKKYAAEVDQFANSKGIKGTIIFQGKSRDTDFLANNAFAHAAMSALYAYDKGEEISKNLGDAREIENHIENNAKHAFRRLVDRLIGRTEDLLENEKERSERIDIYKDLFNNSFGREIGRAAKEAGLPRSEVLNEILAALQNGKLITDQYVYSWTAYSDSAPLSVEAVENGPSPGPYVDIIRNSASPASNDQIGGIKFSGKDSAGNATVYGYVGATILDPTNGSEDGSLTIQTINAGTLANSLHISQGVYTEGTTGGDQGAGTINAAGLFVNGTAVPAAGGNITWTGSHAWVLTGSWPQWTFRNDDNSADGFNLVLQKNSASPAASDLLGTVVFSGKDTAGNDQEYGYFRGAIIDPTNGSEDGEILFDTLVAGSFVTPFRVGNGVYLGAAAGGYQGVGTINATGLYINGLAVGTPPSAATQAEQEAASSTSAYTSPGRQHHHPAHPKAIYQATLTPTVVAGSASSMDTTGDTITWSAAHGLTTGDTIIPVTNAPGGVTNLSPYYVNVTSSTVISLHTTLAGALAGTGKVNLTSSTAMTMRRLVHSNVFSYGMSSVSPVTGVPATTTLGFECNFATALSSAAGLAEWSGRNLFNTTPAVVVNWY